MKTEISINLNDFLNLIKKRLLVILLVGCVCGAIAYAATTYFVTPQYEAGAKLIVNTKQDFTADITNDQITSAQKLADTYSIIVKSRSVLLPVIDKLDLNMSYEQLQNSIKASSVDETQIIQISVRNKDANQAQKILSEMLKIAPKVIKDSVEAGSVKTIEDVYCSEKPVFPNKSLYTALAMLLGWMLAIVFITVKYVSDDTYKSADEITRDTGIAVIGTIPLIY